MYERCYTNKVFVIVSTVQYKPHVYFHAWSQSVNRNICMSAVQFVMKTLVKLVASPFALLEVQRTGPLRVHTPPPRERHYLMGTVTATVAADISRKQQTKREQSRRLF